MKNKILASLLAVCLFAGLAVPAFAISSQTGLDDEITTASFREATYTIKNGSDKAMAAELNAFAGTKKLVQEPNVEWAVENDGKFAFNVDEYGKVISSEDTGSATLIAKMKDGKVVAKAKLVAAKADAEKVIANSFAFKNNSNVLLTGDASTPKKGDVITVIPMPANSYFNADQKADLKAKNTSLAITVDGVTLTPVAGEDADGNVTFTYATTTPVKAYDEYTIAAATAIIAGTTTLVFDNVTYTATATDTTVATMITGLIAKYKADTTKKYTLAVSSTGTLKITAPTAVAAATITPPTTDAAVLTITPVAGAAKPGVAAAGLATIPAAKSPSVTKSIEFTGDFPAPTPNDTARKVSVKKAASVSTAAAKWATSMNASGVITLEVGEKQDLAANFKQGPSSANMTYDVTFDQEYADNNANYNDFAEIVNTADGKCEVLGVAVGTNKIRATTSAGTATIVVTVVEKGTKPAASGTTTTVLSAWAPKIGVGETANIVVKATKAVTYTSLDTAIATVDAAGKLTAVKEGTAKIKVQEEGKDAVYVSLTVTAKTTTPGGTTDVPQTAVVALAPLF